MVELRKKAVDDEAFNNAVQNKQISFDLKLWHPLLGVLRSLNRDYKREFVYVNE